MDKIYNCLDVLKVYEIYKSLGSACHIIYHEHGKSIVSSSQYQDLIHVLHDVESCLAELHINNCKLFEKQYDNKITS